MKANKDYSKAFIDCRFMGPGLCIHIVHTKILCSNLKVCVCISLVPCFIAPSHLTELPEICLAMASERHFFQNRLQR